MVICATVMLMSSGGGRDLSGRCGVRWCMVDDTLACSDLSPPLANFQHVLSILELHEVELIEEPFASKQAVTAFGEFRHEAGGCHKCGSAETSHFDLDRVEVDRPTHVGDDTADVTDSGWVVGEIDAQKVSDLGREDIAVRAAVNERFVGDGRRTEVLRSTMGITGRSIGAPRSRS
jgi:hypothetical protein